MQKLLKNDLRKSKQILDLIFRLWYTDYRFQQEVDIWTEVFSITFYTGIMKMPSFRYEKKFFY